jgi:hypothetical protein
MKKLFYEDKKAIENLYRGIEETQRHVQEFVKQTNNLPGRVIGNSNHLAAMVANLEGSYKNRIKEQLPESEGDMTVNKEERLKSLVLPDVSHLSDLTHLIKATAQTYRLGNIEELFIVDQNGTVRVNKDQAETLADQYRLYANNSMEADLLKLQIEFKEAYNKLKGYSEKTFGKHNVNRYFEQDTFALSNIVRTDGEINPQLSKSLMEYAKY